MRAVNYSTLRENMKSYMDGISDDYEILYITRKGEGRNIVMLSETTYNNMLENIHLLGNRANYDWLIRGKDEIESGAYFEKELTEVQHD